MPALRRTVPTEICRWLIVALLVAFALQFSLPAAADSCRPASCGPQEPAIPAVHDPLPGLADAASDDRATGGPVGDPLILPVVGRAPAAVGRIVNDAPVRCDPQGRYGLLPDKTGPPRA